MRDLRSLKKTTGADESEKKRKFVDTESASKRSKANVAGSPVPQLQTPLPTPTPAPISAPFPLGPGPLQAEFGIGFEPWPLAEDVRSLLTLRIELKKTLLG